MTPQDLREALKKRLQVLFEGETFPSPREDVEEASLQFFTQKLPDKTEEEDEFYPLVLIKIADGGKRSNETYKINMIFVIGIFDEGSDNQGSDRVMHVINKILKDLQEEPLANGQFEMVDPYHWSLVDEDTEPYYFGGIEIAFEAAEAQKQPPKGLEGYL